MKRLIIPLLLMSLTACVNRGHGLHNFGVVDPGRLYRGAQPEKTALITLRRLNVWTVIDLTSHDERHSWEREMCRGIGIRYVSIPLQGLGRVSDEDIHKFLHIVDTTQGPVFVHCVYGSDRTSVVCAQYLIRQGRKVEEVLREAEEYGLLVPAMKHQIEEMKP